MLRGGVLAGDDRLPLADGTAVAATVRRACGDLRAFSTSASVRGMLVRSLRCRFFTSLSIRAPTYCVCLLPRFPSQMAGFVAECHFPRGDLTARLLGGSGTCSDDLNRRKNRWNKWLCYRNGAPASQKTPAAERFREGKVAGKVPKNMPKPATFASAHPRSYVSFRLTHRARWHRKKSGNEMGRSARPGKTCLWIRSGKGKEASESPRELPSSATRL